MCITMYIMRTYARGTDRVARGKGRERGRRKKKRLEWDRGGAKSADQEEEENRRGERKMGREG